jgi:hypothetical protein
LVVAQQKEGPFWYEKDLFVSAYISAAHKDQTCLIEQEQQI